MATERLHPTPSRLALLDEVDAGNVVRDAIGQNYNSARRKVTAEMRDMEADGWVVLLPGDEPRTWQLTAYGRAIAAVRVLEREDGKHIVAEVGDGDKPRHLGDAMPVVRAVLPPHLRVSGGRWLVHVEKTYAVRPTKHEAREELRHMAATLLAAETTTAHTTED